MNWKLLMLVGLFCAITSCATSKKELVQDKWQSYVFVDMENGINQTLSVNWINDDSIHFQLKSENMLCEYSTEGLAIINLSSGGAKIDEDETGLTYHISEYIVEKEGRLSSIRISLESRDKARIIYTHADPADECDPQSGVLMVRN